MSHIEHPSQAGGRSITVPLSLDGTETPSRKPWPARRGLAPGPFLAHLLAQRHDVPEYRVHRRAEPQVAATAYSESSMPAARTGELLNLAA